MGFLPSEKRIAKAFSSFSVMEPALAQVSLPSLSFTKPLSAQVAQLSIFTVFPRPGLPKYRYLQCSRPCPGELAQPLRYEVPHDPINMFGVDAGIIIFLVFIVSRLLVF